MSSASRILTLAGAVLLASISASSPGAQQSTRDFQIIRTGSGLSLHKEMFMMPATFSDEYYGAQTEAVFQISAKHRIFNTPIYFAYTQISFWQAYDHNNSAPFRETNYNPELFWRTGRFERWGGEFGADIGFEHESNGQRPPVSRSWNLIYFSPYYLHHDFLLYLKLRYRIPEDEKEFPEAAVGDDNPDITDYLGHSDIHFYYRFSHGHIVYLKLRGNVKTGRGGVVMSYRVPIPKAALSFFILRISHGYGESLVDYNKVLTRVGIGISFSR